jgi:hypothetical protein
MRSIASPFMEKCRLRAFLKDALLRAQELLKQKPVKNNGKATNRPLV